MLNQRYLSLFCQNLRPTLWSALGIVFLVHLATMHLCSQAQNNTLRRDPEALAVLNKAMNAMGGQNAWSSIQDATETGTCNPLDLQSGPVKDTDSIQWVVQGREFRYEADWNAGNEIYLSGHGKPMRFTTSESLSLSHEYYKRRQPFHLPSLVLQEFLNSGSYTLIFEGEEPVNGVQAHHVRIAGYSGSAKLGDTQEEWWFAVDTGFPIKVSYLLPADDGKRFMYMEQTFSSWSGEGNLIVPHQLVDSLEGQIAPQICTIQSLTFNTNPASAVFDVR